MKIIFILLLSCIFVDHPILLQFEVAQPGSNQKAIDKTIFVYGGEFNSIFIRYVASLTKKPNPRVCFLPTAAADNATYINFWYSTCVGLPLQPFVVRTFIGSSSAPRSFEEQLLECDAIVVGGGNTLNMLGIWKAQGIDTVLRKAYNRGIILAGGSAGSLCWFTGGFSDSRPKELSVISGLSFLNYSHAAHYHGEPSRRPLFQQAILDGRLVPGYACDDLAGLLFVNGEVQKSVTQNADNHSYFVSVKNQKINEDLLAAEIIR